MAHRIRKGQNIIKFRSWLFEYEILRRELIRTSVTQKHEFWPGKAHRVTDDVLEQASAVSTYTNALGATQFCEAFFFAPIVGSIIDGNQRLLRRREPELNEKIIRLKTNVLPLSLCAFFGFLRWVSYRNRLSLIEFSAFLQTIEVLQLQYITVFCTCLYRSFLMGATANFLNLAFPVKHFGKLYGITRLSGGLLTMLAVPIFNYVQEGSSSLIKFSCYIRFRTLSKESWKQIRVCKLWLLHCPR